MADGLAAIPTVIKSYYEPQSESDSVYLLGLPNSIIGLLVIKNWNFQNYGFPLYLTVIQIIIVFLIRTKIGKRVKLF